MSDSAEEAEVIGTAAEFACGENMTGAGAIGGGGGAGIFATDVCIAGWEDETYATLGIAAGAPIITVPDGMVPAAIATGGGMEAAGAIATAVGAIVGGGAAYCTGRVPTARDADTGAGLAWADTNPRATAAAGAAVASVDASMVGACATAEYPGAMPDGAPAGDIGAITFGWYSGGGGIGAVTTLGAAEGAATGMAACGGKVTDDGAAAEAGGTT